MTQHISRRRIVRLTAATIVGMVVPFTNRGLLLLAEAQRSILQQWQSVRRLGLSVLRWRDMRVRKV